MVVIYKIVSPTGKVYIGQSRNYKQRLILYRNGKTENQRALHCSILKYGLNSHTFSVLHELPPDVSQEVLNDYERLYIQKYKECGMYMLNIREGGSNGKLSQETKDRISVSNRSKNSKNKGRPLSDEHKSKLSAKNKGRKMGKGFSVKISIATKGRISKFKGIKYSEEEKQRLYFSRIGRKHSTESRAKMSKNRSGRPLSDLHKQKIAAAHAAGRYKKNKINA